MKLGEAANRLSTLGVLAPDGVEWALAVANRNFLIHQYRTRLTRSADPDVLPLPAPTSRSARFCFALPRCAIGACSLPVSMKVAKSVMSIAIPVRSALTR